MNFQPVDRLPRWEWAMWWDETIRRWHREGLPVRAEVQPGLRHRPTLRPRPLPAVLVQHHRPDHRGHPASRRRHRGEHGRLPAHPAAAVSVPRRGHRRHGGLGGAAAPGRGGGVVHAGGLLLVPAHADGVREAHVRLLPTSPSCCMRSTATCWTSTSACWTRSCRSACRPS